MADKPSGRDKAVFALFVFVIAGLVWLLTWAGNKQHENFGPGPLAVDGKGRVWAAIDNSILITDAYGKTEMKIDLRSLGIEPPVATIAIFTNGRMLVGSVATGEIFAVDENGGFSAKRLSEDSHPREPHRTFHVSADSSGQIFMTDVANHRVLLLDEHGRLLGQRAAPDDFLFPNGIAINRGGRVLIADTNHFRVVVLDQQLNPVTNWKMPGLNHAFPVFVDSDENDKTYVSLHDNNLEYATLIRLSEEGSREHTYALPGPVRINGLKLVGSDILISDQEGYQILRVNKDGSAVTPFGDANVSGALRSGKKAQARFKAVALWAQRAIFGVGIGLLGVLLVLKHRESRAVGEWSQDKSLPKPERQILPVLPLVKRICLLAPIVYAWMAAVFVVILVISDFATNSALNASITSTAAIMAFVPFALLGFMFRHIHLRGILKGKYTTLFRYSAEKKLANLHRAVVSVITPGEKIGKVMEVIAPGNGSALLVATDQRWLVFSVTTVGPHLRRIQAVANKDISSAHVKPISAAWSFLRYAGIPMWQVRFNVGQEGHHVYVVDGFSAIQLCEALRGGASPVVRQPGKSEIVDLPCPSCIKPGKSLSVALLLSAISPGLGQLYNQDLFRGLVMMLAFWYIAIDNMKVLLAYALKLQEVKPESLVSLLVVLSAIWLVSLVHTYRMTRKNARNEIGLASSAGTYAEENRTPVYAQTMYRDDGRIPVYSPLQAAVGSFLGGPLASIFILKHNFRALGDAVSEKKTVFYGAALFLLLLGVLPFIPDNFPRISIPIIIITAVIVAKYQFTKQAIAESESLVFQSNWRVLRVAIVSLVVFISLAMIWWVTLNSFGIVDIR